MRHAPGWARALGVGVLLAVLALIAWTLREPAPLVDADDGAEGEARALVARFEGEREEWRAREVELTRIAAELEAKLASEQELRYAREREWLEFTQLVGSLGLESAPPIPEFLAPSAGAGSSEAAGSEADPRAPGAEEPELDDAGAAEVAGARRALDERARAMLAILRALLTAEQVHSLDFRELGRPHTFEGRGVIGPVVANLVDDRGFLIGGLFAERLWLEVSRSARCVTLVLEDGYETRGGVRYPFEPESRTRRTSTAAGADGADGAAGEGPSGAEGGVQSTGVEPRRVQRIFLPSVDPAPWLEALPELIDEATLAVPIDDGVFDLNTMRLELNELLRRADTEAGEGWRLRALGGVQSGVFRDVQLVEYAADGTVNRRLFADRMLVHRSGRGIELTLEGGSQERNGRRAPFLEGRYPVALPSARADEWLAAGIPGAGRTR